jgi:hypothetical protein
MKRTDDAPLDPEIAAALDAIDATLAGEPVDPRHAELAELALMLAAERPGPEPQFAAALDDRVKRRFVKPSSTAPRRARRRWVWAPAAGLAGAAVVAIVIVAGGQSGSSRPQLPERLSASGAASSAAKVPQAAQAPAFAVPSRPAGRGILEGQLYAAPGAVLQPPPNGRKIVQGAQLSLSTSPGRVDAVAQEVFDVVGQHNGIVSSSNVTAGGAGGYAQFQLSVPSSSLPQTMAALSALRYARVASRTDTTQDVNDQYVADVRRLADARALRTALLKQLAGATTQAQIDSLRARINDAEASISSDEAALRQLNRQVGLSQIALTINAGLTPAPGSQGGGGFTIGKAAHDAGRVLTVAAGVALIVAAALVPVALIVALGWWIAAAVRRRRREQALDAI